MSSVGPSFHCLKKKGISSASLFELPCRALQSACISGIVKNMETDAGNMAPEPLRVLEGKKRELDQHRPFGVLSMVQGAGTQASTSGTSGIGPLQVRSHPSLHRWKVSVNSSHPAPLNGGLVGLELRFRLSVSNERTPQQSCEVRSFGKVIDCMRDRIPHSLL